LVIFMKTGKTIYRREGITLLAIYVLYMVLLLFRI
jgi:Ca2+/Na+ antiporter